MKCDSLFPNPYDHPQAPSLDCNNDKPHTVHRHWSFPDVAWKDNRRVVVCDDECAAPWEPLTPEEIRLAFIHWSSHSQESGCSHGC